ncbi:DUF4118 domain-containing protein [Acrocarpospora macrocephala]|nr:DUF4118 domain-containing protein [Acrocarpospora macrocephala]
MAFLPIRDTVAVAAAVLAPLLAAALLVPLREGFISNANIALIMVVVVVAVAAVGSRVAGALAAISAAIWFDFLFTHPYNEFAILKPGDLQTAFLLLVVGLATSQIAAWARRLRVIAVTDADYLARIHDTAALAQTASSPSEVIDEVQDQLADVLQLRGCRFEYGTLLGHPPRLEQDGTIMMGHWHWDVERRGLPDREIELRTFGNGHYYGRFMLQPTPGTSPSLQARLVAVTLADQAGHALDAAASPTGTR